MLSIRPILSTTCAKRAGGVTSRQRSAGATLPKKIFLALRAVLQNFPSMINPRLLVVLACLLAGAFAAERRPNFLLILSDDHGWSQLSQTMHPDVPDAQSSYLRTPNIDRLAREGLRFSSGYAPAPLCTPTRRSILNGTTAARSGSEFASRWRPTDHLTMPKALKQADSSYRTAHFGKWGEQMNATPEEAGYDASDGLTGNVTGGMPNSLN